MRLILKTYLSAFTTVMGSLLCTQASISAQLPPGMYIYLGDSVGISKPKLLIITADSKVIWQDSQKTSSFASPKVQPSPFFHPSAAPSPSPYPAVVAMPKMGGASIAPMPKAGAGLGSATAPGPAPTSINIASSSGAAGGGGPPTPVPVGGGARSLGDGIGPGPSPPPTRAGKGGVRDGGGGSPGVAVAPSVARSPAGGLVFSTYSLPETELSTAPLNGTLLKKLEAADPFAAMPVKNLYEKFDYPTIKWKTVGIAGCPSGIAQLNTTFEQPDSSASRAKYTYSEPKGKIKLKLILVNTSAPAYKTFTVSLLDKEGFSIVDIPVSSFHEIPGTDLIESQTSISSAEEPYKRAVGYSVH